MAVALVKNAPYNVSRNHCFMVITRSHKPGPDFLKWQPISCMGWRVICLSEHDAHEMVLYCGSRMYSRPNATAGNAMLSDDGYEAWLLAHHFKIVPYEVTGKGEMTFHEWHEGWVPGAEEFRTAQSSPAITWRVYEQKFKSGRAMWARARSA